MFIAIEGIDGAGKGAQAKLLNRWIKEEKGHDTFLTAEPTSGPIGKIIREALREGGLEPRTEALLFAADRSQHLKDIEAKLMAGKIVITERYFYSSIAYQGAAGVSTEWLKEINRFARRPDLVVLLDLPPELALERITSQKSLRGAVREREYFERKDFLSKVRELYRDMEKENDNFHRVDASRLMEEVQTSIRKVVGKFLTELEKGKKAPTQRGIGEYIA